MPLLDYRATLDPSGVDLCLKSPFKVYARYGYNITTRNWFSCILRVLLGSCALMTAVCWMTNYTILQRASQNTTTTTATATTYQHITWENHSRATTHGKANVVRQHHGRNYDLAHELGGLCSKVHADSAGHEFHSPLCSEGFGKIIGVHLMS